MILKIKAERILLNIGDDSLIFVHNALGIITLRKGIILIPRDFKHKIGLFKGHSFYSALPYTQKKYNTPNAFTEGLWGCGEHV